MLTVMLTIITCDKGNFHIGQNTCYSSRRDCLIRYSISILGLALGWRVDAAKFCGIFRMWATAQLTSGIAQPAAQCSQYFWKMKK